MAGEFLVGPRKEVVALCLVLADKQDVGRVALVRELGVAPPRPDEVVVAAELVEVLVGAAGAVVLDQEGARAFGAVVLDL